MKLLVLGSTGPTGRHFVERALAHGDSVTVLVRNPARLGELSERVTVVTGDATSPDDLAAAVAGHDAIVSALGRGTSIRPDGLFTQSASAVLSAARSAGCARLVWLSSFGVGETLEWSSTSQKLMYRSFLRAIYADKRVAEEAIRTSPLDWTVVYPTRLTNRPARGTFGAGDRLPMKGNPTISRADVAAFMHDAVHTTEWIRRSPVITD